MCKRYVICGSSGIKCILGSCIILGILFLLAACAGREDVEELSVEYLLKMPTPDDPLTKYYIIYSSNTITKEVWYIKPEDLLHFSEGEKAKLGIYLSIMGSLELFEEGELKQLERIFIPSRVIERGGKEE